MNTILSKSIDYQTTKNHSRTSVGCRSRQTVIQWLILKRKFADLQVFGENVGSLRGSSGE